MKLNIFFFALMFAPEAQAIRDWDGCRDERATQEHPDRRTLPVCGLKPARCLGDEARYDYICGSFSQTYPNCAALVGNDARFSHYGACKPDPLAGTQSFLVGFRLRDYAHCLEVTARLDAIPADVVPWRGAGPGIDSEAGARFRAAYCRALFPHGTADGHGITPPPAAPGHPRPAAPSYPGGVLPDGTVYR